MCYFFFKSSSDITAFEPGTLASLLVEHVGNVTGFLDDFLQVLRLIRLYCLLCQLSHLPSVQIERMRLTVSRIGVGQCNLV